MTRLLSTAYKLGKAPAKHDPRTCRLEPFLASLPPPPAAYTDLLTLMQSCGMLGNDTHGDCVVADDGHDIELWTRRNGSAVSINDAQALSFYSQASLALNHSAADAGLVMLDFLKWRIKTAWPAPINRPLVGFGSFDHMNHMALQQLVMACGAVRLGVALPLTAQSQPAPGGTWTLLSKTGNGAPGSWGGHDVPVIGYDATGPYVVTWGGVQHMTWQFYDFYCDETYAAIPTDVTPAFDLAGFVAYLQSIGAYVGPVPTPPPAPPAPVPPTPPTPHAPVVDGVGLHFDNGTTKQVWP